MVEGANFTNYKRFKVCQINGLLCMDKDSSSIQKWSFDVLSTDMKIDKECQIGFCPEEKKGKLKI